MRILVAAVGRLKDGGERELCERYQKRFDGTGKALALGPLELKEFSESRAASADLRKAEEAARLLKAVETAEFRIALDERGKAMTSAAFAEVLAKARDGGAKSAAFLIGGPDGHGAEVLSAANMKLSLSAMTLPHGLARVVLYEQLYRAATILSGHPYHRA